MASLLERMNIPATGAIRSKTKAPRAAAAPYTRETRARKGNSDGQWSHDLFESHNSLSARLNVPAGPPKASLNNIAQKAIQEATAAASGSLSIKGASSQGNVVEVSGLVEGTTPADVASIFNRCGVVTDQKLVSPQGKEVRIRITFKTAQAAQAAVSKFHNQPADGKILCVKIVGSSSTGTSLAGRLGGADGLDLVRGEGTVDVLMDGNGEASSSGSKMRSDSVLKTDPRAHVLVAPPGANPADYVPASNTRGGARRGGRGGRGARRGRRGGNGGRMDLD